RGACIPGCVRCGAGAAGAPAGHFSRLCAPADPVKFAAAAGFSSCAGVMLSRPTSLLWKRAVSPGAAKAWHPRCNYRVAPSASALGCWSRIGWIGSLVMPLYFLLHEATRYQTLIRPALSASWRQRSFAPCGMLREALAREVAHFAERCPIDVH